MTSHLAALGLELLHTASLVHDDVVHDFPDSDICGRILLRSRQAS
jgi:geranylgeranyl pyrophosphate synthase